MISMPWSVRSAKLAPGSLCVSSHLWKLRSLVTYFGVLAALTGGACNSAFAQTTAFFAGGQSVVPTSSLNQPVGIAVDQNGNVYIADSDNYRC